VSVVAELERVWFTWPDRGFSYRCEGCGACCRGLGIGLDVAGGQLAALVAKRPAIAAYVRRRGAALTVFNPRDRCWFLADDGLCRVEAEDGRAAKPASCRLFPFNRVFRLGSWTVVDYNSVVCPLQVGGEGAIAHAEVWREIEEVADAAIVGTPLPAADAEREGRELVERERAVSEGCFAAAAAGDLAAAWRAQAGDASLDDARAAIDAASAAITGAPWRAPTGATLAAALWLTPSLRFNELYGPRAGGPRAAIVAALPRMWLAWLGHVAEGAALAGRELGLQELTTIWSEQAPLAALAARWREAPALKPGPIELPGVDPGGLVRRIGQACVDNRKPRRVAGELVAPILAGAPVIDRVAAVKMADAILRAAFAR
jgi:Fe-S-cluster containining protein